MTETIAALLLLGGAAFMMVATIGALRLPDFYTRMHAITKAGTLGIGLILVGIAVFFGDLSATTRAVAVIAFVLFTAPVSAHMIGRAGYLDEVPLWQGTLVDKLRARYDDLFDKGDQPPARRASSPSASDG
ncbi:MAG: Na+/H+ antiporter subunit G [Bacteroidetes bacterium]|jgi:multicomponent Na+:H+ antiporter subunit G|nr:Na+/H+ antiporter subunit G [Bacteroidota bacterium]